MNKEHYYYFMGLIAADGYLTRSGVGLDLNDEEIILACASFFKCHPPKRYSYRSRVLIDNKELREDIISLGIRAPLKKDMAFPILPKKYIHHFMRGYFDGDGSATMEHSNGVVRTRINIRGTKLFIEGLRGFLKYGSVSYKNPKCATYYVGSINVKRLAKFLYKGATIYLERKAVRIVSATGLVIGPSKNPL